MKYIIYILLTGSIVLESCASTKTYQRHNKKNKKQRYKNSNGDCNCGHTYIVRPEEFIKDEV